MAVSVLISPRNQRCNTRRVKKLTPERFINTDTGMPRESIVITAYMQDACQLSALRHQAKRFCSLPTRRATHAPAHLVQREEWTEPLLELVHVEQFRPPAFRAVRIETVAAP
jgi:hypothetical protein